MTKNIEIEVVISGINISGINFRDATVYVRRNNGEIFNLQSFKSPIVGKKWAFELADFMECPVKITELNF